MGFCGVGGWGSKELCAAILGQKGGMIRWNRRVFACKEFGFIIISRIPARWFESGLGKAAMRRVIAFRDTLGSMIPWNSPLCGAADVRRCDKCAERRRVVYECSKKAVCLLRGERRGLGRVKKTYGEVNLHRGSWRLPVIGSAKGQNAQLYRG